MRVSIGTFFLGCSTCPLGPREQQVLARFGKFLLVGSTGVVVNSLALFLLYERAGLPLVLASALSVEIAIANNFLWNNFWTFGRREVSLQRFVKFNFVSLGGLFLTTSTLWVLTTKLGIHYLAANLAGIALAAVWNFAVNLIWTWGLEP